VIRVAVHGAAGRMGRHVIDAVLADPETTLAAAVDRAGHPAIGQGVAGGSAGQAHIELGSDVGAALAASDVVIDFSLPGPALALLDAAAARKLPVVIATTGFDSDQRRTIEAASERMPLVLSPNYSPGIGVLLDLVQRAVRALPDYEIEVLELHHSAKVDAPSGTALRLAEEAASARGEQLADVAVYHREGQTGPRPRRSIGMQTLRAGSSPGEHTVFIAGPGERLELTHRAQSREGFATGAVRAARWLVGRAPGLYTLRDVLGGE
jgi:4-hydroxy-tetrahydrodipicolinate reductase